MMALSLMDFSIFQLNTLLDFNFNSIKTQPVFVGSFSKKAYYIVFVFIAKIPLNISLCLQSLDTKENAKDSEDDEMSDVSDDDSAKKMHSTKKVVLRKRGQ